MQDGCLCTCVFKIKNVGNYCIQLVIGYSRSLIECMLLIPTFLYNNHIIGELLDIWDFFRSNLSKYGIIATNVEGKTEQTKNETNNPKTGDNITTSIMLFVASIATIGTLTLVNRKKARK